MKKGLGAGCITCQSMVGEITDRETRWQEALSDCLCEVPRPSSMDNVIVLAACRRDGSDCAALGPSVSNDMRGCNRKEELVWLGRNVFVREIANQTFDFPY